MLESQQSFNSISENNGLALMSAQDKKIYSVGISTGGLAEIRMANDVSDRHIIATTLDRYGARVVSNIIKKQHLNKKIKIEIEDVAKPLKYPNDYFDFVYARLVLHYLPKNDLKRALQELNRVLKKDGRIFIVVRSKECSEAKSNFPDSVTGMTTYVSDGRSYSRYFHDMDSIVQPLNEAGFQVIHTKTYQEQLCVDFERKVLSQQVDELIEVFCLKLPEGP